MQIFDKYAQVYDQLYHDKNYEFETEIIETIFSTHISNPYKILDLGCGTGRHAIYLATKGYHVTGVDYSAEMLSVAERNRSLNNQSKGSGLIFRSADIRELRLNQEFDIVMSLFHVFSYQLTSVDLSKCFETASIHLKPGGLFIFDCWYGPGVLQDLPVDRMKEIENKEEIIVRFAHPEIFVHQNVVDVNYRILAYNKKTGTSKLFSERHRMRYLFNPEVQNLFEKYGLTQVDFIDLNTGRPPGPNNWSVCYVARRL